MSNTTIKRRYNAVYLNNDKIIDISNSTTDASEVILGNLFYNPDGTQGTGSLDLNNMYSDLKATNNTAGTYIYNKLPLNDNNDNELSNSTEYIRNILDSISHIDITNTNNDAITTNMDSYANGYRSVAFNTNNYAGSKGFYGLITNISSNTIKLSLTDKKGYDLNSENPMLEKYFELDKNPTNIGVNSKILIQSVTEDGKDIREIHTLKNGIYTSNGKYILDLTDSGTNFNADTSVFISIIDNPNFGLTYGARTDVINNFAIGYLNKSLGKESFTAGSSNIGYGLRSATFGYLNTNGGNDTFISGAENNILVGSANSIVSGNKNELSANNSLVIGTGNTLSGSNSFALGSGNILSYSNSALIGNNLESTSENQLIVGNFNKKNEAGIFIVSNGSEKNLVNVNDSNTTITLPTVIDNTLYVENNITGNSNLTINGSTTLGNQKTTDTLNVTAISTFKGNTTIGESTDKLTVNADSEFNNNVKANANMIIGSDSEDTLTVNSVTTHNAYTQFEKDVKVLGNSNLYGPATNIGDSSTDELLVKSHAIFKDTVKLDTSFPSKNTLEVNGSSKLTDLNVTGTTDLDSTLNVDGNATFNANVTIGDTTSQDLLSVKARSTFFANTNLYGGTTTIGDTTYPDETLIINAQLTANNIANFKNTTTFDGNVFVNKNITIGDTLAQDKLTINSTSVFNAKTELYGSQTIIGDSKNDTLSVNATSTFKNPVTLENTTLTVNGAATLNSGLTVNEETVLNDSVKIGSDSSDYLTVNAESEFKSSVKFDDAVNTDGNTRIGTSGEKDKLIINAESTINGETTIIGKTDITGETYINGGAFVNGGITINGTSNFFDGDVFVRGNITFGDNDETEELFKVKHTAIFDKNIETPKISVTNIADITTANISTLNSTTSNITNLIVSDKATIHNLEITEEALLKDLEVSNDSVLKNITVNGDFLVNSELLIGSNLVRGNSHKLILGTYNKRNDNAILTIGGGSEISRKNVFEVTNNGDIYLNSMSGTGGNIYIDGQAIIPQTFPLIYDDAERAYIFTNGKVPDDKDYEAVTFTISDLKALKEFLNNNKAIVETVVSTYDEENDEITLSLVEREATDDTVTEMQTAGNVPNINSSSEGKFVFTNGLPPTVIGYDYVEFTLSEFKALKAFLTNNTGLTGMMATNYSPEDDCIIFSGIDLPEEENQS